MTPAFCANCGAKLTASSRFCPECGARLADVSLPTEPQPQPDVPSQPDVPPQLDVPPPPDAQSEPTALLPQATPVPPTVPLGASTAGGAEPPPAAPRSNARLIIGALIALGALFFGACIGLVLVTLNFSSAQRAEAPALPSATSEAPNPTAEAPVASGAPLFREDFSNPATSVFGADDTGISRFAFEEGGYLIELNESQYIAWWQVDDTFRDIAVAVDTVFPPTSLEAAAALAFHYQDENNYYLFSVSNDGYYALEVQRDGEWTYLINWTESPEIDAVRNALRVETSDNQIALYVNDMFLEETIDDTFTSGDVALAVVSFEEAPASVRFDNLVITRSR